MKAVIVILLSVLVSVPALAGPPANGTYKSNDILGGTMLPGRYSESWFGGPLAVNNTLNEESWDGTTLGTEWHWYCPWIIGKAQLFSNVDGNGNGQTIWRVDYVGGYCWLDGAGPWAGGDASYLADINVWTAIVTETYANFVEVGTIRNHSASATFRDYGKQCMALSVTNVEKLGDDSSGSPKPADYPAYWNWIGCAPGGNSGEWGDVDSITFDIIDCPTVAVHETSWGAVKAMYRK